MPYREKISLTITCARRSYIYIYKQQRGTTRERERESSYRACKSLFVISIRGWMSLLLDYLILSVALVYNRVPIRVYHARIFSLCAACIFYYYAEGIRFDWRFREGKKRKNERWMEDIDPTRCILFKSCELFEAFERKERERIDETRE